MDVEIALAIVYLALGVAAGMLSGLLGVGGGLVIVPVLALVFTQGIVAPNLIMHVAIGTSLASIVVTSIASVYTHNKHEAVLWPVFSMLTPGIIMGALMGSVLAGLIPSYQLELMFGVFEILVAMQMVWGADVKGDHELPGAAGMSLVGLGIGVISSIFGIGGGTMTVPYLTWRGVSIHKAVATSAAVGLPIAIAGSLGYLIMGSAHADLPNWSTGFLYWPALLCIVTSSLVFAPYGANLAHRIPTARLKTLFAFFIAGLGTWMLAR